MTISLACDGCRNHTDLFPFTMAFQPIVHFPSRTVFAHEALVRGIGGEGAHSILAQVGPDNRYAFDQACRVKAIELAARLGMQSKLSINFMPNAVYRAEACIKLTLATAERCKFPTARIIFELTEDERSQDLRHLQAIFSEYQKRGFLTAIDDFGTGYAGFEFLANFQPDIIKVAMSLVRDIDTNYAKQNIVAGLMLTCERMGVMVLGEGVETVAELKTLSGLGVKYFQGFLFAKPAIECLPEVDWDRANG